MKFLVDNQLPPALAKHLRAQGQECAHVSDLGLHEATDQELWTYAAREHCILISKDEDFVFLANRAGETGRLLWVRLGNCRNAALCRAFTEALVGLTEAFASGQRLVELR